jgi:hypothetical protein
LSTYERLVNSQNFLLGRNYIETGEFLEKICPFFGIRFIAINDNFDTDTAEASGQLSVSLSNIINDYYSPYLTQEDENSKNQLIINPTAPVVKQIFLWRSEGMSYMGINKKLNNRIPSPGQTRACNAKKMRKADLDEAVLSAMKAQLDLFVDMQDSLHRLLAMKKAMANQSQQKDEIKSLKKKLDHKKGLFSGLYRDLREGLITDEDYAQAREIILADIDRTSPLCRRWSSVTMASAALILSDRTFRE